VNLRIGGDADIGFQIELSCLVRLAIYFSNDLFFKYCT
jgi:hypothetical protein